MRRYNPKEIEPKWQKVWRETELYKTDMSRYSDKFYIIPMLPYPSGDLHVGHWYNFAPTDTVARFHRMLGQNVLQTIGFDAFGLPAENAAIKRGIQPAVWTHSNIESMTKQIEQIGASYDWSHSLATCDPSYYKWNQWLFLQLYKQGLAYRAKREVNWDPVDKTVLANEQVVDGRGERSGAIIEQKLLEQWFFKITDYADRLLEELDDVDWPAKVKTMQVNWIGKSKGALIDFAVDGNLKGRHFVFLHAFRESVQESFWQWLKKEIEKRNGTVDALELPNPSNPKLKEQLAYVQANARIDDHTTIIGHSLGATLAMKLLPNIDHRVDELILVAPPIETKYKDGKRREILEQYCDWEFDFEVIKSKANKITVIRDSGDHIVPDDHPERIANYLDAPLITVKARNSHFSSEESSQEPAVLKSIIPAIQVFTTRLDTIYGATYMVLAPEHPLVSKLTVESEKKHVEQYIEETSHKTELERKEGGKHKTGVFSGSYAVNPATKAKIPIWIADYVLMDYGTGAIMAVPAHDERDWEFAKKFDLPIVEVIKKPSGAEKIYEDEGVLINSASYDGLTSSLARDKIIADLTKKDIAKEQTNYRLRDWLISRQRYWGTPIPIIYCDKCGTIAVPESDLPVLLPEDVEFELSGRSPLLEREDFVNTKCPECGGQAKRETDTMDTFVCSSWYFLRYLDNKNNKAIFDLDIVNKWAPVDHYIGGIEHAILHLLYARFITKFLHDHHGLTFTEPFKKLTNQGLILGPDGQKMSKSKGNVINPDEQVTSYGTDSLRLYLMFMGPYDQGGPYSMGGIAGTRRFLERFWFLSQEFLEGKQSPNSQDLLIYSSVHKTIKKITQDLEKLDFNTAIASMMGLVNELYKFKAENKITQSDGWRFALETLTQLLAPFAPHITEELWQSFGKDSSVHVSNWPLWDKKLVVEETLTLAVQVNGKVRAEIIAAADITEADAIELAKKDEKVAVLISGQKIKKAIYVPGRLVSLVL